MKKLDLRCLNHGVINDLFDEEWRRVLENIEDENTAANRERSVTIKIAVKPDKTRRTREIKVQASSTLAKIKPVESFVFFDVGDDGKFTAFEDEPGPELPGIIDEKKPIQFPRVNEG
jgi:hypothetical protein